MIMSTGAERIPWLMSVSLPSDDAGNTSMSNLPLVRFLISAAAHTDSVWYGSLVSYTCAHLSFCWAAAGPPATSAAVAMRARESRTTDAWLGSSLGWIE
jgi:hypothetical protein